MFKRYTPESRKAVFFAREAALNLNARAINSEHILLGLLVEKNSRANALFRLREELPDQVVRLSQLKHHPVGGEEPPLTQDGKRILAYAADEANRLRDYWVDTEHLVLGILREEHSVACEILSKTGIEILTARESVSKNKSSRPDLGRPPVLWWPSRQPLHRFMLWALLSGLLFGLYLIGMLRGK